MPRTSPTARPVTLRAAHAGEMISLPSVEIAPRLRLRGADHRRGRQAADVGHQGVAFGLRHVDPAGLARRPDRRDGLGMAGDLQAQLAGTGRTHEFVQAGHLRLPAEPADGAATRAADPAAHVVGLTLGHGDEHLRGDRVDLTRAEEGGRIALGERHPDAPLRFHALACEREVGLPGGSVA